MELINKNPSKNECVIVGAYNALIWSNKPTNYREIKRVAKEQYGFSKKTAMLGENIDPFFRHFQIKAKPVVAGTSICEILDFIFEGKAVLIAYKRKGTKSGHMVMVTPQLQVINPSDDICDWKSLLKNIAKGKIEYSAWILKGSKV
jgi:hypothetical protein